jgi:predicted nucleotidyltransferase
LPSVEECYRGRNVRVFRLDREGVLDRLRERAQAVLARRPDVVEIRLFGSLARGEARPGSDADLFVVLREFSGVGIGCDVIAYTESEARALAKRRNAFARVVFEEGQLLACS